jgi:hypothetical protein
MLTRVVLAIAGLFLVAFCSFLVVSERQALSTQQTTSFTPANVFNAKTGWFLLTSGSGNVTDGTWTEQNPLFSGAWPATNTYYVITDVTFTVERALRKQCYEKSGCAAGSTVGRDESAVVLIWLNTSTVEVVCFTVEPGTSSKTIHFTTGFVINSGSDQVRCTVNPYYVDGDTYVQCTLHGYEFTP